MEAGWFTLNNKSIQKTIFLDRDGVINKCARPHYYISEWEDFEFLPGAIKGIKTLNDAGYLILLITNQRGVARGLFSLDDVKKLHQKMCEQIEKEGARINDIYICPHDKGECRCRKPDIGLLLQAEENWLIDKNNSYFIGDCESDIIAGSSYGVSTILIGDSRDEFGQSFTFPSLEKAAEYLFNIKEKMR